MSDFASREKQYFRLMIFGASIMLLCVLLNFVGFAIVFAVFTIFMGMDVDKMQLHAKLEEMK